MGVQIASVKPMTQESWRELASSEGLFSIMATEETAADFLDTYSLKALRTRHNFSFVDREAQEDAEADDLGTTTADETDAKTADATTQDDTNSG